ncbi:MAG: hypothetical protein ABIP06_09775, partial [Pyrinomonadaceae bacterium]
ATNKAVNTANNAVNTMANTVAEPMPEIDISQPFTPGEDPKNDLLSSTMRLQAHDAWSATLENNLMPEMKTELEYLKPDRYRIKNPVSEVIVIGSDAYVKEKGFWKKIPEDIGAQINAMKKSFNAESMKALKEVKKIGTEKIGGKDATIYTYSVTAGENTPPNSTKVWIAGDGLPLKIVVETQNADATQIVTTKYDYDKKIKIEAPEVKDEPVKK